MNITYSLYHIAQTNGLSPNSVYYAARKLFGRENGEFTKEEAQQILQFINDDTKNTETTSQTGTCSTDGESCGRVVEQVPGNIVDPSHLNSGLQVSSILYSKPTTQFDILKQSVLACFPVLKDDPYLERRVKTMLKNSAKGVLREQQKMERLKPLPRYSNLEYPELNGYGFMKDEPPSIEYDKKEPEDYGF